MSVQRYTLFLANNCHDCQQVFEHYEKTDLSFNIVNFDETDRSQFNVMLYAFPALVEGERILAFGP